MWRSTRYCHPNLSSRMPQKSSTGSSRITTTSSGPTLEVIIKIVVIIDHIHTVNSHAHGAMLQWDEELHLDKHRTWLLSCGILLFIYRLHSVWIPKYKSGLHDVRTSQIVANQMQNCNCIAMATHLALSEALPQMTLIDWLIYALSLLLFTRNYSLPDALREQTTPFWILRDCRGGKLFCWCVLMIEVMKRRTLPH